MNKSLVMFAVLSISVASIFGASVFVQEGTVQTMMLDGADVANNGPSVDHSHCKNHSSASQLVMKHLCPQGQTSISTFQ